MCLVALFFRVVEDAPLIVGALWLGVQPGAVFNITQTSVDHLVSAYHAALGG